MDSACSASQPETRNDLSRLEAEALVSRQASRLNRWLNSQRPETETTDFKKKVERFLTTLTGELASVLCFFPGRDLQLANGRVYRGWIAFVYACELM